MALTDSEIEAVAARVVEQLRSGRDSGELVDANEIARRFGVSRAFIYEHAEELGALRLGPGPGARLRFDPAEVGRLLEGRANVETTVTKPPRRKPRRRSESESLLPIRRGGNR
jgi:DNA-binding GntR family transcriptional regulator